MNSSENELSRELKAKQREINLLRRRLRKAASSSPAPKTTSRAPSQPPAPPPEQEDLPPIESLSYDAASRSWKLRPES